MLKIRLQRFGRKHEPAFRAVLTDSRNSTKSGKFLEILGSHDPRGKRVAIFNKERILYWISKGAKTSDTMHNMLVSHGVVKGVKIDVRSRKKKSDNGTTPANEGKAVAAGKIEKTEENEKKEDVLAESKEKTNGLQPEEIESKKEEVSEPLPEPVGIKT